LENFDSTPIKKPLKCLDHLDLATCNANKKSSLPNYTGVDCYVEQLNIWKHNNMSTLHDYLIYYNNLDVQPFVEAIEKMLAFYKLNKIDLLKTCISIPGAARRMLYNYENTNFALCNEYDLSLYMKIKQNLTGGPSIVFNLVAEIGRQMGENKSICNSIVGYDANSLYLYAIGQPMPTCLHVRHKAKNRFTPEFSFKALDQYLARHSC
jgi:hypothetical protein